MIVLMNACNIYLPLYITVVEQMNLRLTLIRTIAQFGSSLGHLGSLVPAAKHKKAHQVAEGVLPIIELPWDGEEHEYSWLNIAEQMAETLRQAVLYLCEDLRTIDIVVWRVAEEFDGEDPLQPVMPSVVENTREQLKLLLQAVSLDEPQEWPEPTVETMELVEGYFERGKRLMEGTLSQS